MNNEERSIIIDVLLSQALADHLGDIRDTEVELWKLIGIDPKDDEFEFDDYSAHTNAQNRLIQHREKLGLRPDDSRLDLEDSEET